LKSKRTEKRLGRGKWEGGKKPRKKKGRKKIHTKIHMYLKGVEKSSL